MITTPGLFLLLFILVTLILVYIDLDPDYKRRASVNQNSTYLWGKNMNKIKTAIGEALGEASMCWSEIPQGTFDSTRCLKILERVLEQISKIHRSYPQQDDTAAMEAGAEARAERCWPNNEPKKFETRCDFREGWLAKAAFDKGEAK